MEWGSALFETVNDGVETVTSFISGCEVEYPTSLALDDIDIKAPWPAGHSCAAGGLIEGGLYYNQQPTHCGSRAFAVDFARGLSPPNPPTFELPVLAVYQGLVTNVRSHIPDNDNTGSANRVKIDHYRPLESVIAAFEMTISGKRRRSRYSSDSLHLRGGNTMPVSEAMWVEQGTRLGEMDNTGLSVYHHLHFEFRDTQDTRGGFSRPTVMPSPLDSVTLGHDDAGTWITSTNTEVD